MPFSKRNFISRININSPVQGRLGSEVHRGERSGSSPECSGDDPVPGGGSTNSKPSSSAFLFAQHTRSSKLGGRTLQIKKPAQYAGFELVAEKEGFAPTFFSDLLSLLPGSYICSHVI